MENVTLPLNILTDTEVKRLHKRMFDKLRRELPNPQTIIATNALRRELTKRGLS